MRLPCAAILTRTHGRLVPNASRRGNPSNVNTPPRYRLLAARGLTGAISATTWYS
jgi:hypothetical protein